MIPDFSSLPQCFPPLSRFSGGKRKHAKQDSKTELKNSKGKEGKGQKRNLEFFLGNGLIFPEKHILYRLRPLKSLSSRGLGHQVFILVTRVRIPLGMPAFRAVIIRITLN